MSTASTPDTWATADGEKDGSPIIYRYRMNRPQGAEGLAFCHALHVSWKYDATVRNGMPPEDDNERQQGFEDAIETLMTRVT